LHFDRTFRVDSTKAVIIGLPRNHLPVTGKNLDSGLQRFQFTRSGARRNAPEGVVDTKSIRLNGGNTSQIWRDFQFDCSRCIDNQKIFLILIAD
jgi:hypothetical protein